MKKLLLTLVALVTLCGKSNAQLYFPPLVGSIWDTIRPQQLGWCTNRIDSLYDLLQRNNTKAFIILKDGKIAIEKYFDNFTPDSVWYWASAGKTITSFLVGIAQQEGKLSISDSTSKYLGSGWTTSPPAKEGLITIRHQLTMTTGLDYTVPDDNCKLPTCLKYKADAGNQWYYHNAAYLLLQDVIESATGSTYQQYTNSKLSLKTGITGLWYDGVFYSKPRSMARFGLLMLNHGIWKTDTLLKDTAYYRQMMNTSQNLNPSYGYLWWLNGKGSYKLPGSTITFPGDLFPPAPDEMVAGLGKNDQKLYVWPSQNIVIIRMGNSAADSSLVPVVFDRDLWAELNKFICNTTTGMASVPETNAVRLYPNPTSHQLTIESTVHRGVWQLFSCRGEVAAWGETHADTLTIPTAHLVNGLYLFTITDESGKRTAVRVLISH
jgi:CubicO group peptidase (beta-lactamase class C family)